MENMNPEQHAEYMNMIQQGLEKIVASEDIQEIKGIAQELLAYEQKEQGVETSEMGMNDKGFRDKLMKVSGGEGNYA